MFLKASIFLIVLLIASNVGFGSNVIPDHTNLDISYEDEYEAFEKELISSIPQVKKRSKRFIYMNTDTFVAVALLVGVPISLVLPSLSNIFNKWRSRRSLPDTNYFQNDDPIVVQPELDRISTYFQLVDIPEHTCQLRAICEFTADPDKFYPLSEMILSRIRNPNLPRMVYLEHENNIMMDNATSTSSTSNNKTLFQIYNQAADSGQNNGVTQCKKDFGQGCPYSMDKLLNMPTLRFWKAMQRFLQLKFTDGNLSF